MLPRLNLDQVIEEIEQEENKAYDKTFLFDFEKGDYFYLSNLVNI